MLDLNKDFLENARNNTFCFGRFYILRRMIELNEPSKRTTCENNIKTPEKIKLQT
jgi:hypothetical protein